MSGSGTSTRGFSTVELVVAVLLIGIVMSVGAARVREVLESSRVNRVTAVIAAELAGTGALAARQRRPVRVECDCPARRLRVVDRQSGALLHQADLADRGELGLDALALSASDGGSAVTVFPTGLPSAELVVTLRSGARFRTVTLTLAGTVLAS